MSIRDLHPSGLRAAAVALQAAAPALYAAERTAAYSADHAVIGGVGVESVERVNPEVVTSVSSWSSYGACNPARGECTYTYPETPGDNLAKGGASNHYVQSPLGAMPFVGEAFRKGFSEGVRTRGGVGLRYFASGNRAVPWFRYHQNRVPEYVSNAWPGYGAWLDWSGFGIFILAHNHEWDLYDSAWYYSIAGGDSTGAPPDVSGMWHGAAVAMGEDLSFIADGTATLTVTLGDNPTLDVRLGDWKGYTLTDRREIGQPADVSIDTINATDIPIAADGTFGRGGTTREGEWHAGGWNNPETTGARSITGAFYGSAGQEAAGAFRESRIVTYQ